MGRVSSALSRVDETLPVQLQANIVNVAEQLRKAAQRAALSEPALDVDPHRYGGPGLRQRVADGVEVVDVKGGSRIQVSVPDRSQIPIPRGLDSVKGWRHPVFGNKNVWVQQSGAFSWFYDTMQAAPRMLVPLQAAAVDTAIDKIASAGM